jgi:hypothetical protein
MQWLRWFHVLGFNLIPVGGVVVDAWDFPMALFFYWVESAFSALTMSLRIGLHERWTRKRGHMRSHLREHRGVESSGTYLQEFFLVTLLISLAHGFFVMVLTLAILKTEFTIERAVSGMIAIAALEIALLAWELPQLRSWTFLKLQTEAGKLFGRSVIIQLTLVVGVGVVAITNSNSNLFYVFAIFKLLADLSGLLPSNHALDGEKKPGYVTWLGRKHKGVEDIWHQQKKLAAIDEESVEQPLSR